MSRPEPTIRNLMEALERLQEAQELLEAVFGELGPYLDGTIQARTWARVQRFMGFDDSE